MALLEADALGVAHGDIAVSHELRLSVDSGGLVAVQGANGGRARRRCCARCPGCWSRRQAASASMAATSRCALRTRSPGGEHQMLAIARSLAAGLRLPMTDELSLELAPRITVEIMQRLCRPRDEGLGVLIVEQNVQQALRFADRAYVLANGRIELSGTPREPGADGLLAAHLGRD